MQARNATLREYQQHLFERIHATGGSDSAASHLGFEAGDWTWVVPLTDVSEVVPVPTLVSVPLAARWFAGVASIRGSLFAVTDFAGFASAVPTPITPDSRLVLLHPKFRVQAGLLVRRSLGLRQVTALARRGLVTSPWQSASYTDAEGRTWQELNVHDLTRDPRFLQVAL